MSEKTNSRKGKLFIENMLVYGVGGIINRAIPLMMIPLITRIMPNTSYMGISDMASTLVSFGSAFAIMGMYDAMFRLFFEKDDENYKKSICSTALGFTLISSFIIFLIMMIFRAFFSKTFFGSERYIYIVIISAITVLVGASNSIISAPTRMQNKRKVYLVTNTLGPVISYLCAVPLLLKGYYVMAMPLASLISVSIMLFSFYMLNRSWFNIGRVDCNILKKLVPLAIPLMPNFLIYWVYNSCDRLMIANLIGVDAVGIYSVASKLGHASQLIYTAFSGGWQYFAFSTMKDDNQVETRSLIFEILGIISYISTAMICIVSYVTFKILFKVDYISGYTLSPYLFLSPLLLMLFQVIANQFLVIKKPWPSMLILLSGAAVNVLANYFLILRIGIEGASIATVLGYVVTLLICSAVLCRMKLLIIKARFFLSTLCFIVYFVTWRLMYSTNFYVGLLLLIILILLITLLYKNELIILRNKVKGKNKEM